MGPEREGILGAGGPLRVFREGISGRGHLIWGLDTRQEPGMQDWRNVSMQRAQNDGGTRAWSEQEHAEGTWTERVEPGHVGLKRSWSGVQSSCTQQQEVLEGLSR